MNHVITSEEAAERLKAIKNEIAETAEKCGRKPEEITLLAVSKTFAAESIRQYWQLGQTQFGESYIQESRDKIEELASLEPQPVWHFIGHLQSNKAKYAARLFQVIHSIDRLELAEELDRRLKMQNSAIDVYVEVNIAGENSKSGLTPDELPHFMDKISKMTSLRPKGLMTMPPYNPAPETSRPHFAALRALRDRYAPHLTGLSMGMSGDFKVAIEEGSTIIRVGTALFGARDYA